MANITTQTIRVDLSTGKVIPTAYTHQNDTARTLVFDMFNGGLPYTMTGNTVKFAYKSPVVDGQYSVIAGSSMASGTVSGNKVTVALPVAYTRISGVGLLTMIITPTSGTVRPVNIRLVVQKSADGDNEIANASDFPATIADIAGAMYSQYLAESIYDSLEIGSVITADIWETGYYNTDTGEKANSSIFLRTRLIPADRFIQSAGYLMEADTSGLRIDVLQFAKDGTLINYKRFSDVTKDNGLWYNNVAYVAVQYKTLSSDTLDPQSGASVTLTGLVNAARYPFTHITKIDGVTTIGGWIDDTLINTSDGRLTWSTSYKLHDGLLEIEPNTLYYSTSMNDYTALSCYDENMTYLGALRLNSTIHHHIPQYTPSNAKYARLFISVSNDTNEETVDIIKANSGALCAEYPFTDYTHYVIAPNCIVNANGTFTTTSSFTCFMLPVDDAVQEMFQSLNRDVSGVAFDADGNVLTNTVTGQTPQGKLYSIPSGCKTVAFNIKTSESDAVLGHCIEYVSVIRDGKYEISGKSIACIGDSLTWLDGRSSTNTYGGSATMMGYQAVLRKMGAKVVSYGYSGHPYATAVEGGETLGIYNAIVTGGIDLSSYDYIIMFGGLNDMRIGSPFGDRSTVYATPNVDGTTFNGAIGGIIQYIRNSNKSCKVFLMTCTPSELASRNFITATGYRDEIVHNGLFWSVPVIDMFTEVNVTPQTDAFDEYFYDTTHPNIKGMERIGKALAKHFAEKV